MQAQRQLLSAHSNRVCAALDLIVSFPCSLFLRPQGPYLPELNPFVFSPQAVVKRLMTDVPFGVLLSGGLDSSLVAAVASRHLAGTKAAKQWGPQLHTFCVGLEVRNDGYWNSIFLSL